MIGIFDSGVGGLSIYTEIKNLLVGKKVLYFSDRANFPYGEKTEQELEDICAGNVNFLIEKGAKIIVIACNSATVSTIKSLRRRFDVPIVGIEPAIKVAVKNSKSGSIGLIATSRTVNSHEGEKWLKENQVLSRAHSEKLIAKIENNFTEIAEEDLAEAIAGLIENKVDVIALGCTHFHFVKDKFENLYPGIKFYAPDVEVAVRVESIVDEREIKLENGADEFYTTKDRESLVKFINQVLKIEDVNVREI